MRIYTITFIKQIWYNKHNTLIYLLEASERDDSAKLKADFENVNLRF